MKRGQRRVRGVLLASMGVVAFGYVACTSASAPLAGSAPIGDGGGDAGSLVLVDATLMDRNLIPPPEDAAGGGPCTATSQCPIGLLCMYPLTEGCSAHGVCTGFDGSCGGPYCTCTGIATGACGDFGYAPMQVPLHAPPCVATADDGGAADSGAGDSAGQD